MIENMCPFWILRDFMGQGVVIYLIPVHCWSQELAGELSVDDVRRLEQDTIRREQELLDDDATGMQAIPTEQTTVFRSQKEFRRNHGTRRGERNTLGLSGLDEDDCTRMVPTSDI